MLSASFSGGIDIVLLMESIRISKQVTRVDGGTNFGGLMSRPSSTSKFFRKWKEASSCEGKPVYISKPVLY